jgi:hypothetical protein
LELLDFWGRCYPVEQCRHCRPAICRSLTLSAHLDPSAPPSLAAGYAVRQVYATTRDSDSSSRPRRLGGFTTLPGGSRRRRTAGGLPAYPVCPCCPVALADPAEILRRRLTVG